MTIDKEKLKAMAECVAGFTDMSLAPDVVLTLLAEIEGLHAQHGRDSGELRKLCSARDYARRQRDQLKSENAKLRGPEETLVVCQKGKPFTFMSKDPCRYGLCEVTYAAPVRVLIVERDQLKAENEALRNDAERYRWMRQRHIPLEGHDFLSTREILDRRIDAAMLKEQPQ